MPKFYYSLLTQTLDFFQDENVCYVRSFVGYYLKLVRYIFAKKTANVIFEESYFQSFFFVRSVLSELVVRVTQTYKLAHDDLDFGAHHMDFW